MVTIGTRGPAILFLPAPPSAKSGQIALTCLRILVGLIWLRNVVWKVPPDFGERRRDGLYYWTHLAIDHPVLRPYTWLVEHLVLPNFTLFGWGVLLVESALAVLLLTGTAVRLAALMGFAQSLAIGLSVAATPPEWPWAYAMMIGIHAVLVFAPAGQYAAVDAVVSDPKAETARARARRLIGGWGIALVVVGFTGLGLYFRNNKPSVDLSHLEFSLAQYNLRGVVTLIVIGLVMEAAAVAGSRLIALVAAAAAVVAAGSIYVQASRTAVWLGGTNSTAVVFLCAAVVCIAALVALGRTPEQS